jgi:DNA-binding transcriptional ArsR family regulator
MRLDRIDASREDRGRSSVYPPRSFGDLVRLCDAEVRRDILFALRDGPMAVTQLADHADLDITQISHHLRPLRESGVVIADCIKQRRLYRLGATVSVHRTDGRLGIELQAADGRSIILLEPTELAAVVIPTTRPAATPAPKENAR